MFTGIVGSHPEGILSVGTSPTSLCICRGSALIHHPMLDVYGTKGGRSNVGRQPQTTTINNNLLPGPIPLKSPPLYPLSCISKKGQDESVIPNWN
jgi:hypothetical protein